MVENITNVLDQYSDVTIRKVLMYLSTENYKYMGESYSHTSVQDISHDLRLKTRTVRKIITQLIRDNILFKWGEDSGDGVPVISFVGQEDMELKKYTVSKKKKENNNPARWQPDGRKNVLFVPCADHNFDQEPSPEDLGEFLGGDITLITLDDGRSLLLGEGYNAWFKPENSEITELLRNKNMIRKNEKIYGNAVITGEYIAGISVLSFISLHGTPMQK